MMNKRECKCLYCGSNDLVFSQKAKIQLSFSHVENSEWVRELDLYLCNDCGRYTVW